MGNKFRCCLFNGIKLVIELKLLIENILRACCREQCGVEVGGLGGFVFSVIEEGVLSGVERWCELITISTN